jgi:ribulose kinase
MRILENTITVFLVFVLIFCVIFLDFGTRSSRIVIYDCDALSTYDVVPEEVKEECKLINQNEFQRKSISV